MACGRICVHVGVSDALRKALRECAAGGKDCLTRLAGCLIEMFKIVTWFQS